MPAHMRATVLATLFVALGATEVVGQQPDVRPLEMARTLASVYPRTPSMSYIPALSWRGAFRLSELTGEDRWAEAAQTEMRPFVEGGQWMTSCHLRPVGLTTCSWLRPFLRE